MEDRMKKVFYLVALIVLLGSFTATVYAKQLKVFISVDMEGITGVVHWEETSQKGDDYKYFRRIMTKETNYAIEGALAAGATEIVVRDSHGSARNILPDLLHPKAKLLRDWSGGPMSMMEGLDGTFDAVVFIGYHAKPGTADAVLEHTMSGNVLDVSINGVSMPEAGINGLIAGNFNVPVVFLSGDNRICRQAEKLFGDIETVEVKKGIGQAALNLHPDVAGEKIKRGVQKALAGLAKYKPYKLKSPYTLKINLKRENTIHRHTYYPGMNRTGDWELTYQNKDIMEIVKAFYFCH
jgi:D-amino peptidase